MSRDGLQLPPVRGLLRRQVQMAPLTWLRVGGPAAAVFHPVDEDDLSDFLAALGEEVEVLPIGVASNLLVRDGGVGGVVLRLGGTFSRIGVEGDLIVAGAGALDQRVAQVAQRAGRSGLEFMIGIPGTIGGAVRMNAGAFGGETAEHLVWADTLDRGGRRHRLTPDDLRFAYRQSELPLDHVVLRAAFRCIEGSPEDIARRMEAIRSEREASQPLRVATGGSTFKNPSGHAAWRLIEAAGCRGLQMGGAMVSEKHCNFLVNRGDATAGDVEALGELVRERVTRATGVQLEWEIKRVGRPITSAAPA